jgi:hypothetical protein
MRDEGTGIFNIPDDVEIYVELSQSLYKPFT